MIDLQTETARLLSQIRSQVPLVHHITNYVTVNDCANMTLAIGASPVMADSIKEAARMVSIASSLVINIGTLHEASVESMLAASQEANALGIPVVLDPVGVGATAYRTETAASLLQAARYSVIRGNLSEIRVLAGLDEKTRGVDATAVFDGNALQQETRIFIENTARKLNTTLAVTGAVDIVSDGRRTCFIENGRPEMARVTGTGCMCSSLTGAFLAVTDDAFLAALAGVLCMGIAGEIAHKNLQLHEGNASYRNRMIDAVYNLTAAQIAERARLNVTA